MINLPNTLSKGQSLTFTLNKSLVLAAVTDEYWSDSANISKCIVVYRAKSGKGRQRKRMVFDFTQETPLVSLEWSEKSRNLFELQGIVLIDFDNGEYTLSRSELPQNKTISFNSIGTALAAYEVSIIGASVVVKTAEGVYYGWGKNNNGQLGNGSTTPAPSPIEILYENNFSLIDGPHRAATNSYEAAIAIEKDTGIAYGWGRNYYGDIGVSNTTRQLVPVNANTPVLFSQVSHGAGSNNSNSASYYALGIEKDTGKLYTWGTRDNYFGALARNINLSNYHTPTLATNASHLTFSKVYAAATAMGITTTGAIYIWGGLVGNTPILVDNSRNYVDVMGTENRLTGVDRALFAMDDSGKIYSWMRSGCSNPSGILGNGTTNASTVITEIEGNRTYIQMSCSVNHAAAIEAGTNKLYVWGNNSSGQLGDGTTTNRLSPTLVASDKQFSSVKCGDHCTIAVEKDTNDIYVWGNQADYRLGTGTSIGNLLTPTKITLPNQTSEESSQPPVVSEVVHNYVPNGAIYTSVDDGSNVFFGGAFDKIELQNTPKFFGVVDPATGKNLSIGNSSSFPVFKQTSGGSTRINRVIFDGQDTMFVAGFFNRMNDEVCRGLAKLIRSGDSWIPDPSWHDGTGTRMTYSSDTNWGVECWDLAIDGDTLFIGGSWASYTNPDGTQISTARRFHAIDKNTGVFKFGHETALNNQGCGIVRVIGDWVYVAGRIPISGTSRAFTLKRFDKVSGAVDSGFNPVVSYIAGISTVGGDIVEMFEENGFIYIFGGFTAWSNTTRKGVVRLNSSTLALDVWTAQSTSAVMNVRAAARDGSGNVILGGSFSSAEYGENIAKISLATGEVISSFSAGSALKRHSETASVFRLLVDGSSVYASGQFSGQDAQGDTIKCVNIEKFDLVSGTPDSAFSTRNNPISCDGDIILDIVKDSSGIIAAGNFSAGYSRQGVAKFSKDGDGNWKIVPDFDTASGKGSGTVYSLLLDGGDLYAGGDFASWYGTNGKRIVRLNASSGAPDTFFGVGTFSSGSNDGQFDGFPTNQVNAMLIESGILYAFGTFNSVRRKSSATAYANVSTPYWAKVDVSTNSHIIPEAGGNSGILSAVFDGTSMVLGGNFSTWGGANSYRMAKVSKADLSLDPVFVSPFNSSTSIRNPIELRIVDGNIWAFGVWSAQVIGGVTNVTTGVLCLDKNTGQQQIIHTKENWGTNWAGNPQFGYAKTFLTAEYIYIIGSKGGFGTGGAVTIKRIDRNTLLPDPLWGFCVGSSTSSLIPNQEFAAGALIGNELLVGGFTRGTSNANIYLPPAEKNLYSVKVSADSIRYESDVLIVEQNSNI